MRLPAGTALMVALAVWLSSLPVGAEPLDAACRAGSPGRGVLVGVNADGSLAIAYDGEPSEHGDVRLADIGMIETADRARMRDALSRWIGRHVAIHSIRHGPDRWLRRVAHVEVLADESVPDPLMASARAGDPTANWLQEILVRAGIVQVRPEGSRSGCAGALYRGERVARRQKRGIWRGVDGSVLSSRDRHLGARAGAYRIVAGIVVSVGATSRRHYLNFGRDWSRDFTVTIPAGRADAFRAAGRDPETMAGRYVRVRGWLEKWNGAVIEVRHPDAIEVLGRGG